MLLSLSRKEVFLQVAMCDNLTYRAVFLHGPFYCRPNKKLPGVETPGLLRRYNNTLYWLSLPLSGRNKTVSKILSFL